MAPRQLQISDFFLWDDMFPKVQDMLVRHWPGLKKNCHYDEVLAFLRNYVYFEKCTFGVHVLYAVMKGMHHLLGELETSKGVAWLPLPKDCMDKVLTFLVPRQVIRLACSAVGVGLRQVKAETPAESPAAEVTEISADSKEEIDRLCAWINAPTKRAKKRQKAKVGQATIETPGAPAAEEALVTETTKADQEEIDRQCAWVNAPTKRAKKRQKAKVGQATIETPEAPAAEEALVTETTKADQEEIDRLCAWINAPTKRAKKRQKAKVAQAQGKNQSLESRLPMEGENQKLMRHVNLEKVQVEDGLAVEVDDHPEQADSPTFEEAPQADINPEEVDGSVSDPIDEGTLPGSVRSGILPSLSNPEEVDGSALAPVPVEVGEGSMAQGELEEEASAPETAHRADSGQSEAADGSTAWVSTAVPNVLASDNDAEDGEEDGEAAASAASVASVDEAGESTACVSTTAPFPSRTMTDIASSESDLQEVASEASEARVEAPVAWPNAEDKDQGQRGSTREEMDHSVVQEAEVWPEAETCRVDSAPAAILEQAAENGSLEKILAEKSHKAFLNKVELFDLLYGW